MWQVKEVSRSIQKHRHPTVVAGYNQGDVLLGANLPDYGFLGSIKPG